MWEMTEDMFFEELGKIEGWKLDYVTTSYGQPAQYGYIRRSVPMKISIAGYRMIQYDCPVCAVAHALGAWRFGNGNFENAASAIGLPSVMAQKIADASDSPYERWGEYGKWHKCGGFARESSKRPA